MMYHQNLRLTGSVAHGATDPAPDPPGVPLPLMVAPQIQGGPSLEIAQIDLMISRSRPPLTKPKHTCGALPAGLVWPFLHNPLPLP